MIFILTVCTWFLGNYDEGFGGEKHAKKWAPQVVAKFGGVEKVVADKRASVDVSGSSPRLVQEEPKHTASVEHHEPTQETVHEEHAHEEPAQEHHEEPAAEEHHEEPAAEEHHEEPAEEHHEEPAEEHHEEEKEPQGDE